MTLDLDFVRSQFPAFAEPSLAGQAFFENAGGTYACTQVIDRLTRFYVERKVQPYAPYDAARVAGEEMDEARARLSAMLGVKPPELSFGPSTSANTFILAQAFRMAIRDGVMGRDGAIVVTDQDHEANSGPWRRLAEDGIDIREWKMDPETGHLDPAALDGLLADGRVRLVCFPHCSNVVGEINDVAAICRIVHAAGAVSCVDGVSYAPHGLPDIGALGADIYLFSAYKTYGPHQGIMAIRAGVAERLPNQAHWFNGDDLPKRLTPSGPDHAQVAACAGMVDYVDLLYHHHGGGDEGGEGGPLDRSRRVRNLMRRHEGRLLQPLLDYLASREGLRLIGPDRAAQRAPTVAVVLDRPGDEMAARLSQHGIMAGGGNFYAVRALRAMGIDPATACCG